MKRYFLPTLIIFMSAQMFAQTVSDVLKYSYLRPSGTARYLGTGGAMGALGADFSTASSNPAGLALFRSNELTITPGIKFARTDASLPDNVNFEDDKSAFGFDNIGLVFNTTPRASRWKTFNVGIGFNRQNNYNQSIFYQGDAEGTIMNGFYNEIQQTIANGGTENDFDGFGAGLAWATGAVYDPIPFPEDDILEATYDFIGNEEANIGRSQTLTTFGGMNEMVLSFAGNYDEKLMIGATIGVPFVNYRLEGEYQESDPTDQVGSFDNLTYTEYLRTEGIGINLKLGAIYKIDQMFRLGVAFHTPTALGLTDNFSNTFTYYYTVNGISYGGEPALSPDGTFDYKLRTPWRAIASAGVILRKHGFISADVEWVDYSANRYNLTSNAPTTDDELYERQLNTGIGRAFQQTMNIRLGGELALDQFRLRAGVNLNGKPEQDADGFNTSFTLGAGVHTGAFFLDLGYRRSTGTGSVTPYFSAPTAVTDNVSNDIALTLGFKF